ncbi:MAG: filamentous hemagglutinin family protein [Pseudomonadota bacterium]
MLVLAGLGLLGLALPHAVQAQTAGAVLPANTVPVLRSVVSGQAVVNAPVLGAGRSLLTIDQSSQRAIIDWRSFNIGSAAEVQFRQPNSTASTLNRIYDANPTLIQGKLTANGQLLLINQNGILFDRGAQVNTQSLVASTLNLTNERFLSGVLTDGGLTKPAFEGGYDAAGNTLAGRPDGTRPGDIGVGTFGAADAAAPKLAANAGGSIMIFAPRIDNQSGLISAPDGQVILAAGAKAYLALNDDTNDITLRGYRVEVEAVPDGPALNLSNLIRNAGEISADRGNVSLAALAVNQEGRVSAKTAVQSNGSIYLKARTKDGAQSGAVSFKAGSVTEVVPDAADTSTVADSQDYTLYRGVIEVTGRTIVNEGTLRVPGGRIALTAADATDPTAARVYLGAGSETSVAGAWADVDYKKNLQTFRVTSNELKNSPDQKTGILRGATVTVDLREANNILELDGYRDIVARTVTEKAGAGGELQIASSGSVVQRSGALIDASGGGYRYNGGTVNTSRLLGDDGKIYDIASAPELRTYTSLLDSFQRTDARWGQTTTMANPLGTVGAYQAGYSEGLAGGLVAINANAGLVLDGTLKGGVTVGSHQLASAARGATLRIGEYVPTTGSFAQAQRIGNLTWSQQATDMLGASFNANTALSELQRDAVTLAAGQVFGAATPSADGRVESGFGTVELNVNGRIVVPSEVSIVADVGGALILRAPQIDIAGDIRLPAGNLLIRPVLPQSEPISPDLVSAIERVTVRAGADLSTAGTWINNANRDGSFVGTPTPSGRLNADASATALAIDGGNITIQIDDPNHQTRLERGATLDVGGGASIASSQRVSGGKGGKLAIGNGSASQTSSDWMQAELRGFALANGGELNLSLARAVIDADDANGVLPGNTTRLEAGLFSDRGFSKIGITATDGIDIVAGTQLLVQQKNLLVDPLAAAQLPTGGDLASIAGVQLLPDSKRAAASLALNAKAGGQPGAATLTLNREASISVDPKGEVALSAVNGLTTDGRINAPGGKVGLTLNGPVDLTAPDLRLGSAAVISTAGVFVPTPNDRGLVQGTLVNAGAVTLDAKNAGVQVAAGARIDVSGVNQTVDVATSGEQPALAQQTLEGQAGALIVKSQGGAAFDGALLGHGGSAGAAGGSFALELMRPDGQASLPDERRIVVTSGRNRVPTESGLVDATVNIDELTARGFEKLRLQSENRIEFQGSSTLAFERGIRLDAPLIEVAGDARVELRASTVSLGQSLGERQLASGSDGDIWQIADGSVAPTLATRAGGGVLGVSAGAVNLYGSLTINGTSLTRIESDSDIQLIGRPVTFASTTGGQPVSRQIGALTSAGNIELEAAQVYPATRTEYTFSVRDQPTGTLTDGGLISMASNGNAAGSVYSAAGKLTLEAQTIVQAGTLKAPLGEIDLRAGKLLELADGSLTSVSGNGLDVLYGTTLAGILWRYTDGSATTATSLDSVTEAGKHITLSAPTTNVRSGASVDLSGGGDVLAVEFVPGNGGDTDITLRDNTYAIIPTAKLAAMPFDSHTLALKDPGFGFALGSGRDTALYDSIRIGAGAAVPAGEYTLLPARHALLADAYLVELATGSAYRNLQAGQTTTLANGDVVVAGFRSARGTSVRESQSVGVIVSAGAAVKQSSDYNLSGASFFADAAALERVAAPRAPWDAGRLSIENATALTLSGSFETAAASSASKAAGRAAEIDIAGGRIAVVDSVGDATVDASYLQIAGESLSRLQGSVLLGGTRSDTDTGIRISTSASDVLVANSSAGAVRVPELMLAATDSIDIRAGSVLAGTGTAVGSSPQVIGSEASGALVRLSNGDQTRLDRGTASAASGVVRIADSASLSADKSLLIDATQSTESAGQLRAGGALGAGGSLSLSSVQVSLGDTANAAGPLAGLVLSNTDLAAFGALDELVLRGYGAIDLIGSTTLGSASLGHLTLDTPLLQGRAGADGRAPQATLAAREIELANHSTASAATTTGTGSLGANAERVVIGAGAKAVSGFASTQLTARDHVLSEGEGALRVAGALTLQAPRVQARGGSKQIVSAVDTSQADTPVYAALTVAGAAAAATAATDAIELGGRLTLEGRNVAVATTVQARSGQITVAARGADSGDGVTLASGALLDARGQAKDFNGSITTADGGTVALNTATGAVAVQAGAKVDVSAAVEGGAGGRVTVQAAALALAGELAGRAGAGERSGSVALDLGALANFTSLNTALNAGGFAEERQLRVRSGDLAVAATDNVAARRVTLAADTGRIDVAGTIGPGAADGGARVNLFADTGLALAAGSRILANGSNAGARGGELRIATRTGALDFDSAATIDVRAGDAGVAGSVIFGVGRDDNNAMGATRLDGTVKRWSDAGLAARSAGVAGDPAASVDLEATRTYRVGSGDAVDIDTLGADHAAFVAVDNAATTRALRDETGALAGARVLGATEVQSTGNLTLASAWDLTNAQWLAADLPGTLTLRAAGDLTLSRSLGSPNDALRAGDTWNLRLVAGVDLAAANPLATLTADRLPADTGSLMLTGANAKLRTGTGRDNVAATIYPAGRIGATDSANTDSASYDRWAVDGGGISITAGGELAAADGAGRDLWINEWLRRPRQSNAAFTALQPTDWWSHRPRFQQGVGTLGGGDIDIAAGGSVSNLAAMLPTSGRTYRDDNGVRQVDVQGGGNLSVRAGEDVVGSSFLVARGAGRVEAAGDIGTTKATQLYVMGASSGAVPEGASIDLVAGGAVALQSVSNPTAMFIPNKDASDAATGPSFGTQGSFSTFFTYSASSRAGVTAKSGDLAYEAVLSDAGTWRTFNRASQINAERTQFFGAFPASLDFSAFNGDISGPLLSDAITTFPSTTAHVTMFAGDSLVNVGFYSSDRDPATVITPTTSVELANIGARQIDGRAGLQPTAGQARIVSREVTNPYAFELQALNGSIQASESATAVVFTAAGRVRAGVDIVGASLQLQNLEPTDVTEVRADTGDFRAPIGIEIRGPGQLLLQAGRNIDLGTALIAGGGTQGGIGGLVATGNTANPQLAYDESARVTLVAGVKGKVDLTTMDGAYTEIIALNAVSADIIDLYRQLGTEPDASVVLAAADVAALATRDPSYARFASLDTKAPRALAAWQDALRVNKLPLGPTADSAAAAELYRLLNSETDVARLQAAGSVATLAAGPGGAAYGVYVGLDQRYPSVFTDYLQRRSKGALPTGVTPIVFSNALAAVVAEVVPTAAISGGNISSYQTSIQTYGGSAIDLWAPGGNIVVGLTTPGEKTVGVLTNAGGAIRSVLSGDFNINQGKLITAQGGDVLLLSSQGSIDAGRGAKTSLSTPPPVRQPILDAEGNQIGVRISVPAGATGSGIQTLSSDPDGLGPLLAPKAGDVYLFAPAGSIDAGEAGIRSSGNIVLNAQTVLNASNISSAGTSVGVPLATTGSLASSLASGSTTTSGSKAAEDAAGSASKAARAAAAAEGLQKPTILTVEVLGFGDKNCKEQQKDCFAK